jgi:prepilin-type N-terminal cleavage/methylation domain-containing protein
MLKSKLDQLKAKDGFTIIEVIIVLVIAAIIMLAVFLVVPQLQRTQRNSRRQNDARRVLAAGEQFAANNSGYYPTQTVPSGVSVVTTCSTSVSTTNCGPIANITGDVNSPSNAVYSISATRAASNMNITYNTQSCDNNSVSAVTNSGKFVVSIYLENSNTTTDNYSTSASTWCVGN